MSTTTDQSERVVQDDIRTIVEMTGRSYVRLQNTWWGNEKFGRWNDEWLCSIERETEKALLLKRVVPAGDALRVARKLRELPVEGDESVAQMRQGFRGSLKESAWGEPRSRARGGWVPKSAVEQTESAPGPEEFQLFVPGEDDPYQTRASEGDVVIREEFIHRGKRRKYRKLAVDADYEVNEELSDLEWDSWKCSYEFSSDDEFMCMSIKNSPVEVAERINEMGYSVAVHEDLIEE